MPLDQSERACCDLKADALQLRLENERYGGNQKNDRESMQL